MGTQVKNRKPRRRLKRRWQAGLAAPTARCFSGGSCKKNAVLDNTARLQ
jgi:hypothetical protein